MINAIVITTDHPRVSRVTRVGLGDRRTSLVLRAAITRRRNTKAGFALFPVYLCVSRTCTFFLYDHLTPSALAVPNCCCSKGSTPYWSNLPFLIFDIRALWRSVLSARAPECQTLKMVGQTSMAKCKPLTGSAVKGLKHTHSALSSVKPVGVRRRNSSNRYLYCQYK